MYEKKAKVLILTPKSAVEIANTFEGRITLPLSFLFRKRNLSLTYFNIYVI